MAPRSQIAVRRTTLLIKGCPTHVLITTSNACSLIAFLLKNSPCARETRAPPNSDRRPGGPRIADSTSGTRSPHGPAQRTLLRPSRIFRVKGVKLYPLFCCLKPSAAGRRSSSPVRAPGLVKHSAVSQHEFTSPDRCNRAPVHGAHCPTVHR